MKKVQIKFISKGFRDVLFSKGVKEKLTEEADAIKARASGNAGGAEYVVHTVAGNYGGGRWIAFVQAGSYDAVVAEAEQKALSRAVR